jgi:phospholipid/cholesterol/gamma-HCH transport system substrate-binding protein
LKISREVKTAVLVVSGILLFIYSFNFLKGEDLLNPSRNFFVEYDNVEGLTSSTPVTINGLIVGKVKEISFKDDASGKLLVELLIDSDFKFSKNSVAQLYDASLIGGKAVAIVPAFDNAAEAKDNDYLQSDVKQGITESLTQKLVPLQDKIESVILNADTLLKNFNEVLDAQTKSNLKASVANLNATISSFKTTSGTLNAMLVENQGKLTTTFDNVELITGNLSKVSDSIAQANLGETIKNLQSTVGNFNTLLANIENGQGSIGKLMKDDGLYNNLEGASKQLEQLLQDMKINPKRYVHFSLFGKKQKGYDSEKTETKDN